MSSFENPDVLIIGAGIIGVSVGIALLEYKSNIKVIILDKENALGIHASGRNSGVIHAGFYYSPDSLKAKFCRLGNIELKKLCKENSIPVMEVGKVVVARNPDENAILDNLFSRGIENGVDLELLDKTKLKNIEPLAVTYERFLWSPTTAVSDPISVLNVLKEKFSRLGGRIELSQEANLEIINKEITLRNLRIYPIHIINAAGAQSDKIAKQVGIGKEYAMVPFMGVYRATPIQNLSLKTLVYPTPHPINPFLGVHFTLTIDGKVKIGPTAIPVLGREQYSLFSGLNLRDFKETFRGVFAIASGDTHGLKEIMKSEWPKLFEKMLVKESMTLVPSAKNLKNWKKKPPGIRSQLVRLSDGKLEQDFIVKNHLNSTHILNAVSPGWTSALPFGRWIVENSIIPNL